MAKCTPYRATGKRLGSRVNGKNQIGGTHGSNVAFNQSSPQTTYVVYSLGGAINDFLNSSTTATRQQCKFLVLVVSPRLYRCKEYAAIP